MPSRRFRHLLLLAHVWACLPFLLVWLLAPHRVIAASAQVHATVSLYLGFIAIYLIARTVLALCDPSWLVWEYVFPPVDVLLISIGLHLRQDPDSVLMLAYFFAIAEAASTLDVRWACLIGLLSVGGAALAGWGQAPEGMVGAGFRLFFLVIMASLLTWMARLAAELQARLKVAAERSRMALEMHDGVQGQLVTIAAQMELVQRIAPQEGMRAAEIAADSRDLARQAAEELRYLARRLRSSRPAEAFLPALQQYLQQMGARNDLEVDFQVSGRERALCPEQEHALFRIAQESLTNVIKHARAARLEVKIAFGPQAVQCVWRDNGAGFDVTGLPNRLEGGLGNMEARAEQIGATLAIESGPSAGTTITLHLPYRPCEERDL